jgi:hypothetical protein
MLGRGAGRRQPRMDPRLGWKLCADKRKNDVSYIAKVPQLDLRISDLSRIWEFLWENLNFLLQAKFKFLMEEMIRKIVIRGFTGQCFIVVSYRVSWLIWCFVSLTFRELSVRGLCHEQSRAVVFMHACMQCMHACILLYSHIRCSVIVRSVSYLTVSWYPRTRVDFWILASRELFIDLFAVAVKHPSIRSVRLIWNANSAQFDMHPVL